ncbi:MAG: asparagine synthase (glutamine-hydrolyzing) [Deltaproteobacteria bacterium]
MCGISGFVTSEGRDINRQDALKSMASLLRHRGPDETNFYVDPAGISGAPRAYLGHNRLRIIDLTASASQPMPNEARDCWIVFNGEIYNYTELKTELKARGHVFRSNSDTEVIIHGYEEYGDDVVTRIDGMFAFAIWDSTKKRMLLARDRTGKKPLYYAHSSREFTFASEIKSIISCPWIEKKVLLDGIVEYLTLGYVLAPKTMYEGIQELPPATRLVLENGFLKGPEKFWDLKIDSRQEFMKTEDEAAEDIRRLLTGAVEKRLASEVPLGAFLSGGIDSSIIVAIMSRLLKTPVRTFSIGFGEDASFDETRYAEIASRRFSTRHTTFRVNVDAASILEKLLWHHDQPYGDSAAIPTYLVCSLARRHVTVALNGDGGDEVFAGYDRFRAALFAQNTPEFMFRVARVVGRFLPAGYGYYNLRRRLLRFAGRQNNNASGGNRAFKRFLEWISIFSEDMLSMLLKDYAGGDPLNGFAQKNSRPLLDRLLDFNFHTYLPYDLNAKMDRMSMAASLETRSPFLDTALIEYAAKLPARLKIRGRVTKHILRKAFRDQIPAEILKRPKHGFGMPLGLWFKGALGGMFKDIVLTSRAESAAYLNADFLEKIFNEHQKGVSDHGYRLWTVLQFEMWLKMIKRPAGNLMHTERLKINA